MKNNLAVKASVLSVRENTTPSIPNYLQATYWWAYIDPRGVKIFERQWLVNLILWGNYRRLIDEIFKKHALQRVDRSLQIACAYGNLTARFAKFLGPENSLDVIDILPIQLDNLAHKLSPDTTVQLHCMNSTALLFPDKHFDQALLFFLLHEQPREVRAKTLAEAVRVIRSGGQLIIVDYARPFWFNPLRYIMAPILALLEPYARDLWKEEVKVLFTENANVTLVHKLNLFGGMYQVLTFKVD